MSQLTGQIAIYQTDEGQTQIDMRFEQDSVWLATVKGRSI